MEREGQMTERMLYWQRVLAIDEDIREVVSQLNEMRAMRDALMEEVKSLPIEKNPDL